MTFILMLQGQQLFFNARILFLDFDKSRKINK